MEMYSKYREDFLLKTLIGRETNLNKSEEVIKGCARLAYKDMLTAGRFYLYTNEQNPNLMHDAIDELIRIIKEDEYNFNREQISEIACFFSKEKQIFNKDRKNYATPFGLAQKFYNMMFKYLWIFSKYTNKEISTKCDCPLDSVVLNKIRCKSVWSKLTYDKYKKCQEEIQNKLEKKELDDKLKSMGNLAYDFLEW